MVNHFLITVLGICAGLTAIGQELPQKSMWQGQIGSIRLILKVFPDSLSGKPKAVFDSPDQNANNLAVSNLNITSDSLVAFSKVIGGGFSGKFNETKSEISGSWKQGKADVPLTLIKIPYVTTVLSRPQTPLAPFEYRSENVEYDNETNTVHFGGTLTVPANGSNFPAVILITGSGQQDRDETIFNHKPFAVIADHLTKNGIAVLRVDDRGVGQTTGEVKKATSADFAKDVVASIRFLKSRKDINVKQIGLIGHSEGGMIASMVANESDDVAFMVSMAGIGIKGVDVIKKQNSDILKKSNMPDEQYKALIDLYFNLFDKVYAQDLNKNLDLETAFKKWKSALPKALIDTMQLNEGQAGEEKINSFISAVSLPWMRYFIRYNPETILSKIKIPVLALNGSKDIQVSATENLAGFERLLKKAGNKNFKTQELPGLNHLFQTAETGNLDEYARIDETISPEVLRIVTEWVKGQVK